MSALIAEFDPSAKTSDTFAVTNLSNGIGVLVIYNDSAWSLNLTFPDGSTDICPAWLASIYELTGPAGRVTWTQDKQVNMTAPDLSNVWVVAYRDNERIRGTFPAALTRQTKQGGGSTNIVGSSSTGVINDNQPLTPSNVFVESTPSGAGASTVSIATDGTVTIKGDVANVLTTLLQLLPAAAAGASSVKLADSARQTEVLGTLLVDKASSLDNGNITSDGSGNLDIEGTLNVDGDVTMGGASTGLAVTNNETVGGTLGVTGLTTATGGIILPNNARYQTQDFNGTSHTLLYEDTGNNVNLRSGSNNTIQIQDAAAALIATFNDTDGIKMAAGNNGFTFSSGGFLPNISFFTGAATGTYNHTFGASPFWVSPMCDVVGSQTMGYDTVTTTQVHITSAAGLGFKAFCA